MVADFVTNIKRLVVDEIHQTTRKNSKRRKVIIHYLVEVIPYAKVKREYKYTYTSSNKQFVQVCLEITIEK